MFGKKTLIVGLVTVVSMLALLEIMRSYAGSTDVMMETDAADAETTPMNGSID